MKRDGGRRSITARLFAVALLSMFAFASAPLVLSPATAQQRSAAPPPPSGPGLAAQEPPPPPPPPSFPEPPASSTTRAPVTTTTRRATVTTRRAVTTVPTTLPEVATSLDTTTTTTSTLPRIIEVREVPRDRIPVWMWVVLGLSVGINLAILGAFLNNRYRTV